VLHEAPVPVAEVSVSASVFGKAAGREGAVVRRGDIMTTPGGTADVFQSLRALPGINAPNEGAALYVRGGDPRETLIRIDGGDIGHPYHYEGASGGLFAALDSYMLKSALFSTGGFSSKYGGVLSGVLDIETQDPMNLKTVTLGANLAGGGLSSTWALVPDRLSFIGSARVGRPELLFHLYGSPNEYQSAPRSRDDVGRLLYRYSPTGRASFTFLGASSDVQVDAERLNVADVYARHSGNDFYAANLSDVIAGRVAVRGQVAAQRYDSDWSFGATTMRQKEHNAQANVDAIWSLGDDHELSFGANLRHLDTALRGRQPADSTDLAGGAPTRDIDIRARVNHPGVYVEDKVRVWGPVYATLGARFDYASRPGAWTADPRAALAWLVTEHQTLRVATGRYHQLADPARLDPVYGNPELRPLRADHVIAGYEWQSDLGTVRVEAFRKDYRDLVTQNGTSFYANEGFGYARGVDVFVQGSYRDVSGWISYGYLDSRRKELDDPREVTASYGVRHSLTLVSKVQATSKLQVGAKLNMSSGRPYTPIVGAVWDPTRNLWQPIEAENNSGHLPAYHRLDMRLTRLFSLPAAGHLPESSVCVFYIEAMNVLNTRNVLDYVYSEDYTQRRASDSYFSRRMLVAGFALTW
jgi:vitamin B12 transporter